MNLESIKNNMLSMVLKFSIPSIIAMLLTSSVTIVDGFFVGNYVGKEGLAGINLGLPILYIYLGIGIMLGVGGIAISSISLGQGDIDKSNRVFNQTMISSLVISIALSIVMYFLLKSIINIVGLDKLVGGYFYDYYKIMFLAYPIMILNSCFGMFIRGEGRPEYFMMVNLLILVSNVILDYIFLNKFNMAIRGVALASLISLVLGLLATSLFFIKQSKIYKFKKFVFDRQVFKDTILNGSSELIGQLSMTISMALYNLVIMKTVGIDGIAAFTVVGYVGFIFSMVVIGFGQGASPLISYSYGAGELDISRQLRKLTNKLVLIFGIILIIISNLGSDWYSSLFLSGERLGEMIKLGLLIYSSSFLFAGINTINSFYFTSIGKAKESAIISGARGLVILIISILILPKLFGMVGVWLTSPMTELMTFVISYNLIKKESMV